MSVNSTSLSNSTLGPALLHCCDWTTSFIIANAFNFTRICLLLPLSIFILSLGHRQWKQQRSFKLMSHSDMFTYHNAAIEVICNLGAIMYFSGLYSNLPLMSSAAGWVASLIFPGEMFFHLLTCVERYLAVVHPITYLGLKNVRGVKIRNISIACSWLLSFVWSSIITQKSSTLFNIHFFSLVIFSLIVISFCCFSVLHVLIRPRPGEGSGDRDQTRQRAFFAILALTGVQLLWFLGSIVCVSLPMLSLLSDSASNTVKTSGYWFSLPSSFVLPVLYLHRTGKLSCCH